MPRLTTIGARTRRIFLRAIERARAMESPQAKLDFEAVIRARLDKQKDALQRGLYRATAKAARLASPAGQARYRAAQEKRERKKRARIGIAEFKPKWEVPALRQKWIDAGLLDAS